MKVSYSILLAAALALVAFQPTSVSAQFSAERPLPPSAPDAPSAPSPSPSPAAPKPSPPTPSPSVPSVPLPTTLPIPGPGPAPGPTTPDTPVPGPAPGPAPGPTTPDTPAAGPNAPSTGNNNNRGNTNGTRNTPINDESAAGSMYYGTNMAVSLTVAAAVAGGIGALL